MSNILGTCRFSKEPHLENIYGVGTCVNWTPWEPAPVKELEGTAALDRDFCSENGCGQLAPCSIHRNREKIIIAILRTQLVAGELAPVLADAILEVL